MSVVTASLNILDDAAGGKKKASSFSSCPLRKRQRGAYQGRLRGRKHQYEQARDIQVRFRSIEQMPVLETFKTLSSKSS